MEPETRPPSEGNECGSNPTTFHVARARDGERASVDWVVARFTPLLLVQAILRMGPDLRAVCEPEDVVHEVWFTALPRLPELEVGDRRATPVLVRFLSTTLLHHVNNLLRKQLRRPREGAMPSDFSSDLTGAFTAAARREISTAVRDAIDELGRDDREILVLHGIEQRPVAEIADRFGLAPATVYVRYHRAIQHLRKRVAGSAFDDL